MTATSQSTSASKALRDIATLLANRLKFNVDCIDVRDLRRMRRTLQA